MTLTAEHLEELCANALVEVPEYVAASDPPAYSVAYKVIEAMRTPISSEALVAAGWVMNTRGEYLYGDPITEPPCVIPSPRLSGHLFVVMFDQDDLSVVRSVYVLEDDGEFSDIATHATGIQNMYDLMTWVRLTGGEA